MKRGTLRTLAPLECQDAFHYGIALATADSGEGWEGYESTFAGRNYEPMYCARRARELTGIRGRYRTKAERRALGFAVIAAACVDADTQGIDPYTGEVAR